MQLSEHLTDPVTKELSPYVEFERHWKNLGSAVDEFSVTLKHIFL
jgi:hypothetical protein